jgi:hypothetical protein
MKGKLSCSQRSVQEKNKGILPRKSQEQSKWRNKNKTIKMKYPYK